MNEFRKTLNTMRGTSFDSRALLRSKTATTPNETGGTQEYKWRVIAFSDLKTNLIVRVAWQKNRFIRSSSEEHVIAQVGRIDIDKDGGRTVTFRVTNAGTTTKNIGSTFTVNSSEDIEKRYVYHERETPQEKK
jgi:uncharacterized protein YfaS (alpha-2-macroglobulin family)